MKPFGKNFFTVSTKIKLSPHGVCGEAANGLDAIEKARELKPDLILLDISTKPEAIDQVVECVRILLQLASASLPAG